VNALRWARTQWDRVAAWACIGLGGLAIVLGWNGVSSQALTAQQVPYIVSGGIGGLFLLGVGAMLWLSADLRDEWRKLDAIERNSRPATAAQEGEQQEAPEDDPFAAPTETNGDVSPARRSRARRAGRAKAVKAR
jgi:hypothetical protein